MPGTIHVDDKLQLRHRAQLVYRLRNNSGGTLNAGAVVIYDTSVTDAFTSTTTQNNDLVAGVLLNTVANQAYGDVLISGFTSLLKVNGTTDIAKGDYISTFTSAGIGAKATTKAAAFAIALEVYTTNDSNGVIDCWAFPPSHNRLNDGDEIQLGTSADWGMKWSKGDSDNHAAVIYLGASNEVLHIANAADKDTDWNVSANAADSEVLIHSDTTPATDYLRLGGHNGTRVDVEAVGGTLAIAAVGEVVINDDQGDVNFRVESDGSANLLMLDAGQFGGGGGIGLGSAAATSAFVLIDPPAMTAAANTSVARLQIGDANALTVPSGTTAIAAGLWVDEPNFTATGTITSTATVYIVGPAGEGGTQNQSLWVDAGTVRFDANLVMSDGTTIGAAASATNSIAMINGTAPSGNLTNGISLYAEDTSSSSELKVRDEAGNIATLS